MNREHSTEKSPLRRLSESLWRDHDGRSWLTRWLLGELRVFYFIVRGFKEHQCALQASALTFVTLLSMVPLLALGLATVKGLGIVILPPEPPDSATTVTVQATTLPPSATRGPLVATKVSTQDETLQRSFGKLFRDALTRLTADQVEVRDRIISYVQKSLALKTAGILLLLVAAISALGTMEHVFNQIWGIRRSRSLLRKFTDYLSVVIVCPLLLVAAMAITTALSSNALLERLSHIGYVNEAAARVLKWAPYLSVWVALAFLYLFLPNTRVKLRCALIGGFVAGIVWQFAFWGYAKCQAVMTNYSLVYSTLAALPIFLSWLYLSWLIVLFGAEVAAAYQNVEAYSRARITRRISPAERLRIGLNLVLAICARFRREEIPWTADQLSRYLECPARLVDELLADLTKANIVMPAGTGRLPTYQPAIPLNNISPARVIEALQETEAGGVIGTATPEAICARTLMDQWREGLWRELGHVGFDVLVEELRPDVLSPAAEKPK